MRILLTTNPGIEDVCADEAQHKLGARIVDVRTMRGRVIAEIEEDRLYLVENLRSVHRVRILLAHGRICGEPSCLNELRGILESLPFHEYITPSTTFAVRAERAGEHGYTSLDIARVAGDAVIAEVRSVHGQRPPVDLDYPAVIVAVDVIFDEYFVGIELGGDLSWHRRGYRVYEHPAALKPTLAYAMIVLSGMVDGETLLDPMCGGGTIPIEAAYIYESSRMVCLDYNPRHIRGAMMNALAAQVANRIRFVVGDARRLTSYVKPGEVDRVVSNPPYGIRLGSPREVHRLYDRFIPELARVAPKRSVLITTEHDYVKQVAEDAGLKLVHERRVAHGGLWPKILVFAS